MAKRRIPEDDDFGQVDRIEPWAPGLIAPDVGFNPPAPPERFRPDVRDVRINPPAAPRPFNQPFQPMGPIGVPGAGPEMFMPETNQPFQGGPEEIGPRFVPEASPESRAAMFAPALGRYRGRYGAFSKPFRGPSFSGGAGMQNYAGGGMGNMGIPPMAMVPGMPSMIPSPNAGRARSGRRLY
jgi:hypothetical protein